MPLAEHARTSTRSCAHALETSGDERPRTTRKAPDGLLLAFYGDDFTGSTDAMEALAVAGVPTVLFLEPPTPQRCAALRRRARVGVAGVSARRARRRGWTSTCRRSFDGARGARRADPPLQGLLDLRLVAARSAASAARSTSGVALLRAALVAAGRRRAAPGALLRLRQPDLQHGLTTFATLPEMCFLLKSFGVTPLVRVPYEDNAGAQRALDAGAEGVIFPYIESSADARKAASACRYPPQGISAFGPYRAPFGADIVSANEQVLCLPMIEYLGAMDRLDEILATDGVDGVFIGPNDLSISLGGGPVMASLYAVDGSVADTGRFSSSLADIRGSSSAPWQVRGPRRRLR